MFINTYIIECKKIKDTVLHKGLIKNYDLCLEMKTNNVIKKTCGNVLGNNVGNDNSVTNINNNQTKVQTPIIAGNNNDSVNSVTNGNRAFM